ncbi:MULTISPECIES: ATP-binding protein [unclassified Frankia]|uniref:ATP-binding protein n=1 Tax=unclassified Frankia TaxID=2632575 RepID=UPI00111427FB|nr:MULTISPECIES: histidine kinase [unclassified Frankia]
MRSRPPPWSGRPPRAGQGVTADGREAASSGVREAVPSVAPATVPTVASASASASAGTVTAFGEGALELGRASVELGRAYQALEQVMGRVLVTLRAVAVLLTVCYVAVWRWYDHRPAAMAVAGLTAIGGLVFCVVGLRRGIRRSMTTVTVAMSAVLALTASSWLPPASVGDSGNFVFLTAINAGIVTVWTFPTAVASVLLLTLCGATLVGGWGHNPQVFSQTAMLLIIPGLLGLAIGRLRRIARTADQRWANVAARHRSEAVVLAVARDRRERERVIHDTVLNTLTGIAWGGGRDVELTRRRCAQSLTAVRGLLDRDDEVGPPIGERLAEVVRDATRRGLQVSLDDQRLPAIAGEPPGEPPAVVVEAFVGAVGEALVNVERHAGTRRASLLLGGGPGLLIVTVSDAGCGFDPRRVDSARLGLRESIVGRLVDVAGTARIDARPGQGTVVELQWRAPDATTGHVTRPHPSDDRDDRGDRDDHGAGRAGGRVADRRDVAAIAAELRDAYAAGLRRALGQIAGLWLIIMLVPLVGTGGWVRTMAGAGALWLLVAVLTVVFVRRGRSRPISGPEAAVLLFLAVAVAVAGIANTVGADIVRIADWPLLVLPLLLAFITASRPLWEWVGALLVAIAMMIVAVFLRGSTESLVLARLGVLIYGACGVQIVTAMLGPLLRGTAETTARALAAEAEVAAQVDASTMIRWERAQWLRTVGWEVLPLLDGVAGGWLDPREAAVRSRCAMRAAAVRRMITGGGPSSALADLDVVVADAEAAGMTVQIQLSGDLRLAPAPVRAMVADQVREVLAAVPGGRAIVTVLWTPAGGSVFVSLPWPQGLPPPQLGRGGEDAGGIEVAVELDDRCLSLELTWPAASAVTDPTGRVESIGGLAE